MVRWAMLLALAVPAAAQNAAHWRGETVFPRANGVPLRDAPGGKAVGSWAVAEGRVVKLGDGDWIEVRHGHYGRPANGWVTRSDVVRLADAAAFYTDRVRAAPGDAWGWRLRGSVHSARGDHPAAVRDFTEALRPDWATYNDRGLGWAATGDVDKAVADYTAGIRLNPAAAVLFNNRGSAWRRAGEFDKAVADYTAAVRLDPASAAAFHNRGLVWSDDRGEFRRAIADFDAAVRLDPKYAEALAARGVAYAGLNEFDKALADCDAAVRLEPANHVLYSHRGWVRHRAGRLAAAAADLDRALELSPGHAQSHSHRGNVRVDRGDYAGAAADLTAAARLAPRNPTYAQHAAILLATCPDARVRDGRRAVELATQACELTRWKDGWDLGALGMAHAEVGDFSKAIEYGERALADARYASAGGPFALELLARYTRREPYRFPPAEKKEGDR